MQLCRVQYIWADRFGHGLRPVWEQGKGDGDPRLFWMAGSGQPYNSSFDFQHLVPFAVVEIASKIHLVPEHSEFAATDGLAPA